MKLRRLFISLWCESALVSILSFSSSLLTVRILEPESFGRIAIWLSIVGFISFVIERGLYEIYLVRYLKSSKKIQPAVFLRYVRGMNDALIPLLSILLVASFVYVPALLFVAYIVGFYFYRLVLFRLLALRNYALQAIFHAMIECFRFLMLLLLLFLVQDKQLHQALLMNAVVLSYPAAQFLGIMTLGTFGPKVGIAYGRRRLFSSNPIGELKENWRRYVVSMVKSLNDAVPMWILGAHFDPARVGIFNLAQRLVVGLYGFVRRAETSLLPHFSSPGMDKKTAFFRAAQVQIAFSLSFALISMFCIDLVGKVIPAKYADSFVYFKILVFQVIPLSLMGVSRAFVTSDLNYALLLRNIITFLGVTIGCLMLSIGVFGADLMAFSVAHLASICVSSLFLYFAVVGKYFRIAHPASS
jgi:O-antigen/teichoic acid export membrane protein